MAYDLSWHVPNRVLFLSISGDYTLEDASEVNRLVTRELDQSNAQLSILIDVRKMSRPVNFVNIRATQTFMDHRKLQHIYVAASDRLVKLSMIVIFNLGKAYLHMFDDLENATLLLQRQLESTP
jgi:hypothetical protein